MINILQKMLILHHSSYFFGTVSAVAELPAAAGLELVTGAKHNVFLPEAPGLHCFGARPTTKSLYVKKQLKTGCF